MIFLYICCFLIAIVALEFLMITRKRIVLVRRLKKVCKQEGHKIRFVRNRFKSVFFDKGKLDLVIEGDKGSYAVVILTSRHRRATWQFSEEEMAIYKKVSLRLGGGVRSTRSGAYIYRSSNEVASFTKRKEIVRIFNSEIVSEYPDYERIILLNPVPIEAKEIIGSASVEIGDRHVLKCGFMIFGLSGFIRYISK